MSEFSRRIARIKLQRFIDVFEQTFADQTVPDRLPAKLRCLLPDHDDSSPSFWLHEDHWWCFGCGRGGDVLDFTQAYYDLGLKASVEMVEAALGLGSGRNSDLQALVQLARRGKVAKVSQEWLKVVDEVLDTYSWLMDPYLKCSDETVYALARRDADYVVEELEIARSEPLARTERARRQRARSLHRWAIDWGWGTIDFVARATGKDRLDVALQRRT